MASRRKLAFAVDACAGDEVYRYLVTRRKIKVCDISALGLSGTGRSHDDRVIDVATSNGMILITADKGFTENHRPLCKHEGIIKFSGPPGTRVSRLKRFLKMSIRHDAWKSVTHLRQDEIYMKRHNGEALTLNY